LSLAVHIFLILWLFVLHNWAIPAGIGLADFWIGIPGLVITALMVITSAKTLRRVMSVKTWSVLHRAGLHLFWFIYTACLIDSFILKSPPYPAWHYVPLIALLLAMAGVRLWAWMKLSGKEVEGQPT
jgi:DMSO/TMAO reductase YedYZ heme-binding membrane subunit